MEEVQFLLLLVTVLTQTLLTLVRSHLVTLMLLSVWHSCNDLPIARKILWNGKQYVFRKKGGVDASLGITVKAINNQI